MKEHYIICYSVETSVVKYLLILSPFVTDEEGHKIYRKQVLKYAREEKRSLEDLRHRLIFGSKQFVEKIHKQYLTEKDRRDMLLDMIWRSGHLSNEQIGQLVRLSYSAVS